MIYKSFKVEYSSWNWNIIESLIPQIDKEIIYAMTSEEILINTFNLLYKKSINGEITVDDLICKKCIWKN